MKISKFAQSILTLTTGTSIAQVIPILISPILTRIYSPDDFGLFALYMSVVSLLAMIVSGRYELAIMLPKKDIDAIQLLLLSMYINIMLTIITFLVIVFFSSEIANLLGNNQIKYWLYLVPFSLFILGTFQILNYWYLRSESYKLVSKNKIIQSSSSASSNLSIGIFFKGINGLIISNLFSQLIATLLLIKKFFNINGNIFRKTNWLKIVALSKIYKKMPLLNMPNAFVDALRISGINILISKFFSTSLLGSYSLALRIVQLPMNVIGTSISQVVYKEMATCGKHELFNLCASTIKKCFLIGITPFLGLYFLSPFIFSIVFGEDWRISGVIVQILAPWLFVNFIASPISTFFLVINKQEVMLAISFVYMLVPLAILYVFKTSDFLYVLNLLSISLACISATFILIVLFYSKKEKNHE